jgi:ribonucleotide monophosphatase NagD (HAD superfamily)
MIKLSDYDNIILDGFGTLYDKKLTPIEGSSKLLSLVGNKGILFSNVGSLIGLELKERLLPKIDCLSTKVLTSLDLLCLYIKDYNIKTIYHYGGESAKITLSKITLLKDSVEDEVDAVVFTSLPANNWIKESQNILRYIYLHKHANLILANPDRLLPGDHIGINIGMMFDMLIKSWPIDGFQLSQVEIGKPFVKRSDLLLNSNKNLLVIGDNPYTDGGLAKALNADFILISEQNGIEVNKTLRYSDLNALLRTLDV